MSQHELGMTGREMSRRAETYSARGLLQRALMTRARRRLIVLAARCERCFTESSQRLVETAEEPGYQL